MTDTQARDAWDEEKTEQERKLEGLPGVLQETSGLLLTAAQNLRAVQALVKDTPALCPECLYRKDLAKTSGDRVLVSGGKKIQITQAQETIMQLLTRVPGKTVPYESMLYEIYEAHPRPKWYREDTAENADAKNLQVHVCMMRKKFREAGLPIKIETVWGVGYRILGEPISYAAFMAAPS